MYAREEGLAKVTSDYNLVDQSDSTAQIIGSNLLHRWPANSYCANPTVQRNLLGFVHTWSGKIFIKQLIAVLVRG